MTFYCHVTAQVNATAMLLKRARIFAVLHHWIPEVQWAESVAENRTSKILPSLTVDDSSSNEFKTDIREQASSRSVWRVQAGVSVQSVQPCQVVSSVSAARKSKALARVWPRITVSQNTNNSKLIRTFCAQLQ